MDDATERYASWLNDPNVNQYLETRFSPQTVDACASFIESCNADENSCLLGIFDSTDEPTPPHIGNIKIGFINRHYDVGQLSLFIGEPSCWGKGYATEAIQAVSQYGFRTLNLEKIEAGCYEKNTASLRAFLNVGYSVEGFLRSSVVDTQGKRSGIFRLGLLRSEL